MCAMRLTMEDWTHKPHRQGLFSSNAIAKTFNSWRDQTVGKGKLLSWESQSSSNIVRVDDWVVNRWWIWMIRRCKFFCTQNLLSSLDPSNSYSCLSQWSLDQIFWFVVSKAICSCKSRPHFHVNKATKQWRIVEIPYQKLGVPESRSTLHQLCSIQRSRGSGHGLVVSRIAAIQWLCCQLCCETAANQRTSVEIQLLASVGWKWGYQAFSCPRSLNVMHCRKEICSTSLSKGIQFLPEDWGRWEQQHAPSALHDGCIMLAEDRVEVSKIWITG